MSKLASIAVAIAALVVAACGSDDDDKGPSTPVDSGSHSGSTYVTDNLELTQSGVRVCPDPYPRQLARFDEVAAPGKMADTARFWGGGVAAGDLNGDDRPDIVLAGPHDSRVYMQQPDGLFLENLDALSPLLDFDRSAGASMADYDGDGDLDVFITRYNHSNYLLQNNGDGTFTDVTDAAGVGGGDNRSQSSAWGDFDRDGDLDLIVSGHGEFDESEDVLQVDQPADPSLLYRYEGDGTFTDVSDLLPQEALDAYTFVVGWLDLDDDGNLDLFFANDFPVYSNCWAVYNRGNDIFELDPGAAGLNAEVAAMGLAIGDLNDDGVPDLGLPAWGRTNYLQSSDSGVWIDYTDARGLQPDPAAQQTVGWGAEFVDIDNDADLDMVVAYGFLALDVIENELGFDLTNELLQRDGYFSQNPDGTFTDLAVNFGLDDLTVSRGFTVSDLNDDGYPDVVKRDLAGPTTLKRSRCGSEAWLRIRLRAPAPNTYGIGARVIVESNDQRWTRWMRAGGTNFLSSNVPEVHVGLGGIDRVDRISVVWPDGVETAVNDIETRQVLTFRRPDED